MLQHCVSFTWDASATKYAAHDWIAFREAHSDWVGKQQDNNSLLYCLHPLSIDTSLQLYRIVSEFEAAEREFAVLCDRHHAIGVYCDRFLRYALLRPQLAWPPNHDLQEFLSLGWTPSDVACVDNMPDPTGKINHRLRAAAGRLISMPTFIAAKANLRLVWEELPDQLRPLLPIARSFKAEASGCLDLEPAQSALVEFIVEFDKFCDEWHLLGLTTWELPDVRGPNWVPGLAPDDRLRRGDLTVTTPWHFPVLAEDGLGRLLQPEHHRQAAERGVDDEESWQTYASLLQLFYWESVLRERYARQQRVRGFVTKLNSVLSEILDLSSERVQKHRKTLHALQAGKLHSVRDRR